MASFGDFVDTSDDAGSIAILDITIGLCIVFSAVRMIGVYLSPVAYAMTGEYPLCFISVSVLTVGLFYLHARHDRYLSEVCIVMGLTLLCQICAREFCNTPFYFGAGYPLQDEALAHIDQSLGFCWPCTLEWFNTHHTLNAVCDAFYHSIFFQPLIISGVLIARRDLRRVSVYMVAYNVAYFITNVVSFRFPALGVYEFFHISPAAHPNISIAFANQMTAPINAIRDGYLPEIYTDRQILISFPSFHAVLAVLFSWSAWRSPIRWAVAACNAVMLVSTPIIGGHYLVDVIVGLVVGAISIALSARLLDALLSPRAVELTRVPLRRIRRALPGAASI